MKLSRLIIDSAGRPATAIYLLLVTLSGLPLVSPLLRWSQVPCTHDGHLHYHRLAAMRHAWENGLLFSRWLPDVVYGYGYPFFNYREAPPLYVSLFAHLLGVPLPASINLLYILSIILAGWFMFLWVRDLFGPLAGLVSAVAYMAAPYVLIDALVRGNQPESMGLTLLPLIAWSGRRFIHDGSAWSFLVATLSFALLALSHNISILLFAPWLLAYLLLTSWWSRLPWQTLALRLALVFGLGLGLALFYLGPALLELDQITIRQSVSTRGNDFRLNFATLAEIFAPVSPADPTLLNPPLLIRLGWVHALLAALGLVSLIWTRGRERRGNIIFMGVTAFGMLFMALAISTPLWEGLPLIEFVQFPWRFVGRAALPVAFLAGVPFAIMAERTSVGWRRYLVLSLSGLAILLLLLEATPNLYPHHCREPARPTINNVHEYEHNTGMLGIDPEGSYFPRTALSRPDGSSLEVDYQAGESPKRFDLSVLPDGATLGKSEYGPLSAELTVTSPEPFQARYLSYDFPGWVARLNGEEIPIKSSDPEGLITFAVPAGTSIIEIDWRSTPLRLAMSAVSMIALSLIALTTVILSRRHGQGQNSGRAEERRSSVRLSWTDVAILGFIIVLFLLLKLLVVDRIETPLRRVSLPDVTKPADVVGGELRLTGYVLGEQQVSAGAPFEIDLSWTVEAPPTADYQSSVWLSGQDGLPWSEKETHRPRTYEDTAPTRMWLPGQWAWDNHQVQVLSGAPPGSYDIMVTLFDLADLKPLTLTDNTEAVIGPAAVIGQIEVIRPDEPPQFSPEFPVGQEVGSLMLLGFSQDRLEAAPGDQILLTLFWEKPDGESEGTDSLHLDLVAADGRVAQSWTLSPVRADYPPGQWLPGERLRGQHSLRLAAGLESGDYSFGLAGLHLGDLEITAPERLFEAPPYQQLAEANFADQAELVGYTLEVDPLDPQALALTLVWRGLAEMPVSYRVFVHLVDNNGHIVTQSDAEPASWGRPTTGWAVGEYVVDPHTLQIPADSTLEELALRVGLYDASSGQRLQVGQEDAFQVLDN